MTDARPIKLGVLPWNQYTDWPSLRAHGARADTLGYDSLWTWDHLYPIVGSPDGPMLEGYMVLAGWSAVTERATFGLLVGANTFRNPGVVAKTVTALDHLSNGRAVLGLGAAWFDTEHTAFGLDFGASVGERLDRLDESVDLIRQLLDGRPGTARGEVYHAIDLLNEPPPLQERLPILIGGGGERKTLQTVARYADAWNVAGVSPEEAARKRDVLYRWCEEVDRDPSEIELTVSLGPVVIRDDAAEAERVWLEMLVHNGNGERPGRYGTVDEIASEVRPYVEAGFRHVIYHQPPPFDDETLERFATEVRPQLV